MGLQNNFKAFAIEKNVNGAITVKIYSAHK